MRARIPIVGALLLAGCVVRPADEPAERERAEKAGAAYSQAFAQRELPKLFPDAPLDVWLAHAERSNGELEATWHEWIAALERVPQASTQPTTAMVGLEHRLDGGAAIDRTGLMLMSDAMNNIVWPGRLGTAGEEALARARVAAAAFDRARLRLQTRVTEGYLAIALRDEEIRLRERLGDVLSVQVASVRARVQAGEMGQTELLKAQVALDRVDAELARLRQGRPALIAALRGLAGAGPDVVEARAVLPVLAPLREAEEEFVAAALRGNPELRQARAEVAARGRAVELAEWDRVPEFTFRGVVMGDAVATLAGAFTLPWLRGTAIEAMVREAEAELRAAGAMRRQAGNDAVAMVLAEVAMLRAVAKETEVLEGRAVGRLRAMAEVARAAWGAGRGGVGEWAEAAGMEVEVGVMVARLKAEHGVGRARLAELAGSDAGSFRQ
jgi:outer membrane protein TolC